jgi:micrococcal nuclease
MAMNDLEGGSSSSNQELQSLAPISRPVWAAIVAALVLLVCLCGFVGGSILISAGVSAYSGWAGVAVTRLAVTVAFVSGPTYTPYPTYTLLPTYTPLPTYTLAPSALPPTETLVVIPTPTGAPPGIGMLYTVQEGDTPQSVADQFGVDVVLVIAANGLDPENPTLQPGGQIRLPTRAADLCAPEDGLEQAVVTDVIDGDTINVQIDGQDYIVRYIGIDAPDMDPVAEPFGPEALTANAGLVAGQMVTLLQDVTQVDEAGMLPRYTLLGDLFINYELVRLGWADAASTPPDTACDELFALAASQARAEGLGMWAGQATPQGQTSTPMPVATGTATPTPALAAWMPPATFTPTSTSSLGFTCNCKQRYAWGTFYNNAQADVCEAICEIAAGR